jgi:hypothetical protein
MIILFGLLIILLFIIIIIAVILYDYDVSYRTHRIFRYLICLVTLAIIIIDAIACVSTSNSSYKSTSTIPIVTPILLPVH